MHDEFFKLYSGTDTAFMSMTCVSCAKFAYFPSECKRCQRLTCTDCRETKGDICNSCQNQLGEPGELHFIVAGIMERAVFRCPYECGEEQLKITEIEQHIQESCPVAFIQCPNRCGENYHIINKEEHHEGCLYEPIICDQCNEVTVPRHQINHHKNESCFAKVNCERCPGERPYNEEHGLEQCLKNLAAKVEQLEKEKVDRDSLLTLLLRKVDKKANDQLLYLLVNDFEAAREQIN